MELNGSWVVNTDLQCLSPLIRLEVLIVERRNINVKSNVTFIIWIFVLIFPTLHKRILLRIINNFIKNIRRKLHNSVSANGALEFHNQTFSVYFKNQRHPHPCHIVFVLIGRKPLHCRYPLSVLSAHQTEKQRLILFTQRKYWLLCGARIKVHVSRGGGDHPILTSGIINTHYALHSDPNRDLEKQLGALSCSASQCLLSNGSQIRGDKFDNTKSSPMFCPPPLVKVR